MTYEEITRMVAEESPDIIYLSDPSTYKLLYLNRTAMESYGFTCDAQWLNMPCYRLLQHKDRPCRFCTNKRLRPDRYLVWTYHNPVLNGNYLVKDKLVDLDGRPVRLEVASDISAQAAVERELQERLHTQETLVKCIQTLNWNDDIDKAIQDLLSLIAQYHQADHAYVFQTDEDGAHISNTHEWCRQGVRARLNGLQRLPYAVAERWFAHFERCGEFLVSSLPETQNLYKADYESLARLGIQSIMSAPLRLDGRVVGFLGVDNPTEFVNDMTLLHSVASFVVNDLNKSRMAREHLTA